MAEMKKKLNKIDDLKEVLHSQISWYKENMEDEGLIYDDLCDKFSNLSRGDYVSIIQIILREDEF